MTLLGSQKFKDTQDVFERDPYIAEFQYFSHFSGSEVKVTFIGAHLDPDDVVAEMRVGFGAFRTFLRFKIFSVVEIYKLILVSIVSLAIWVFILWRRLVDVCV